jgi:cytochrome c553
MAIMKRLWILAATISGALASTGGIAAGNPETGAAKAVVCQACHGANGNSVNPEWPSLAGLGADYIAEQLKNFKESKRNNPIMMPNAMSLSADDMADLGAYFDSQVNTGLEADPSYWQAGLKLYRAGDGARGIPACMACHGPTGFGNAPAKFPALRGQHSVYVVKQLNDYASGARSTGPNGIMQTIAKRLSPDDIRNVASFLQGLR